MARAVVVNHRQGVSGRRVATTAGGAPCCCAGGPLFKRLNDCCHLGVVVWVPEALWRAAGGNTVKIGGTCWDPQGVPLTEAEVRRLYPGETILPDPAMVGTDGCTDRELCPPCGDTHPHACCYSPPGDPGCAGPLECDCIKIGGNCGKRWGTTVNYTYDFTDGACLPGPTTCARLMASVVLSSTWRGLGYDDQTCQPELLSISGIVRASGYTTGACGGGGQTNWQRQMVLSMSGQTAGIVGCGESLYAVLHKAHALVRMVLEPGWTMPLLLPEQWGTGCVYSVGSPCTDTAGPTSYARIGRPAGNRGGSLTQRWTAACPAPSCADAEVYDESLVVGVTVLEPCGGDGRPLTCEEFLECFVAGLACADINDDGYVDGIDYDLAHAEGGICGGTIGRPDSPLARRAWLLARSGARLKVRR